VTANIPGLEPLDEVAPTLSEVGERGRHGHLSRRRLYVRRFLRSRGAVSGLAILALLILFALVGPLLTPYTHTDVDFAYLNTPPSPGTPKRSESAISTPQIRSEADCVSSVTASCDTSSTGIYRLNPFSSRVASLARGIESARYIAAHIAPGNSQLPMFAAKIDVSFVSSTTVITETRELSLSSATKSLVIGARAKRNA